MYDPRRTAPSLVSVIIPALNAQETIGDQLEALSRQTYAGCFEVLIADNGSSDATVDRVLAFKTRLPGLRVIDASQERGAGYARNTAVAHAAGEFLAMCDADDVVSRVWLEELVHHAPHGHILTGPLLPLPENHRGSRNAMDISYRSLEELYGTFPYAPSGNLGIWADIYHELGGFSQDLRTGEDKDLSWRAQRVGYQVVLVPGAVVQRRERTGFRMLCRQFYEFGRDAPTLSLRNPNVFTLSRLDLFRRAGWVLIRVPYLALTPLRRRVWLRSASFLWGLLVGTIRGFSASRAKPQ